jgi:hypothetical protein
MPLKVFPKDVAGRWMDWATALNSKSRYNIHPVVVKFLEVNKNFVYDETAVVDAYQNSTTGDPVNEAAATPFPNYRTWELVSNYLFSKEKTALAADSKKLNRDIIKGLIGPKAADILITFLVKQGYTQEVVDRNTDDIGKFLDSALDAGLPALLIGPSSMGKTARVNSYCKKIEKETGSRPEIIHINLASMDNVDVMGMPTKKTIASYVTKDTLSDSSFKFLSNDLKDIVEDIRANSGTGLVDTLTVRSQNCSGKWKNDYTILRRM